MSDKGMSLRVAVSECRCGKTCYVIKGPRGPEIVCDCGRISRVKDEKIRWGKPVLTPPRYAMVQEVEL